jgi:hypothetical protein
MRHTVPKNLWAKYQQLLGKHNDAEGKALLADNKVTISPQGNAILWDPSKEFMTNLMNHLARERTFVRSKSANLPIYTEQVEKLKALTGKEPEFTGGYQKAG